MTISSNFEKVLTSLRGELAAGTFVPGCLQVFPASETVSWCTIWDAEGNLRLQGVSSSGLVTSRGVQVRKQDLLSGNDRVEPAFSRALVL